MFEHIPLVHHAKEEMLSYINVTANYHPYAATIHTDCWQSVHHFKCQFRLGLSLPTISGPYAVLKFVNISWLMSVNSTCLTASLGKTWDFKPSGHDPIVGSPVVGSECHSQLIKFLIVTMCLLFLSS